jgi:putative transposase
VTEEQDKQTVSVPAGLPADARQVLADQLVEQAKTDGISLIGPGGLLSDITKRVLETGLEVELTDHLGYEKHSAEGRNGGNSRNGTRSKAVITDVGPVVLDVPRDRDGTFDPALVRKRQRRLNGVDGLVISL